MLRLLILAVSMLLTSAACSKTFHCEQTEDSDGIRYCYASAAECGENRTGEDSNDAELVSCNQRKSAYCRPDPFTSQVCTMTEAGCRRSMPTGYEVVRIGGGESKLCQWIH